jgi:hypothetical protein
MEKHYTFLIANRVVDTYVFAEQNDDFATRICIEKNFDKFIWLDDKETPAKWSTYDKASNAFTLPTKDYLISIGIMEPAPKEVTPKAVK